MNRFRLILLGALAGLAAAAIAGDALRAHGIGKPQVLNEPAGPYLLSAWTDPDPLREDEAHVVVAVTDPQTRGPIVTGVDVEVQMVSPDAPADVVSVKAGTDNVNQLLYAAEFNDKLTAGRWQVTVHVSGEQGVGEGSGFEIEIEPARGFNWLWLGVGGMAAIVIFWVAGAMRSEQPERSGRRKPRAAE